MPIFREPASIAPWLAALLMAAGVWLHLIEWHEHTHEPLDHVHSHVHDEHHQHERDFPWDGRELHTHPHYPDIHHRHPG